MFSGGGAAGGGNCAAGGGATGGGFDGGKLADGIGGVSQTLLEKMVRMALPTDSAADAVVRFWPD